MRSQQVFTHHNAVIVVLSGAVRPQFGQWLLEQVQSRRYDGLYMIDHDTFRIPWKHNSRKDCGDEDNKIFRVSTSVCPLTTVMMSCTDWDIIIFEVLSLLLSSLTAPLN